MTVTYWALNAVFLAAVVVIAVVAGVRLRARAAVRTPRAGAGAGAARRGSRVLPAVFATGGVLIGLTAIFDNVMIAVGLVGYSPSRISGAFVGIAPLEDFAYAVAAVILLPSLWMLLGTRRRASGDGVSGDGASGDGGVSS